MCNKSLFCSKKQNKNKNVAPLPNIFALYQNTHCWPCTDVCMFNVAYHSLQALPAKDMRIVLCPVSYYKLARVRQQSEVCQNPTSTTGRLKKPARILLSNKMAITPSIFQQSGSKFTSKQMRHIKNFSILQVTPQNHL